MFHTVNSGPQTKLEDGLLGCSIADQKWLINAHDKTSNIKTWN